MTGLEICDHEDPLPISCSPKDAISSVRNSIPAKKEYPVLTEGFHSRVCTVANSGVEEQKRRQWFDLGAVRCNHTAVGS
jgi:hypothetical protein